LQTNLIYILGTEKYINILTRDRIWRFIQYL